MSLDHTSAPETADTHSDVLKGGKLATYLSFFIAGFALACWTPLVPFAQARLQADAATMGHILLCLGLGAVVGMPISGALSGRLGAKPVIVAGAFGLLVVLPLLTILSGPVLISVCLLVFGASIGAIDVAANVHGTEVQRVAGVPLMSGFHGAYSVGGLVGAGGMALAIAFGAKPEIAAASAAGIISVCILIASTGFFGTRSEEAGLGLAVPKGIVLILGLLTLVCFLAEGAMLDWSALMLNQEKGLDISLSGLGFALFSLSITAIRLVGDRMVLAFGERLVMAVSFVLTGFLLAFIAFASTPVPALIGMFLAGLAVGNIVPILFTLAGRQRVMPVQHAVAMVGIFGYLGVLLGPALIGYAAHWIGLIAAFYALAILVAVSVCALPSIRTSDH